MYIGPNFAFNKDPKESLGFLIGSDNATNKDNLMGYIVKGSLGSQREVTITDMTQLPLGMPDNKNNWWILDSDGELKKRKL